MHKLNTRTKTLTQIAKSKIITRWGIATHAFFNKTLRDVCALLLLKKPVFSNYNDVNVSFEGVYQV